MTSQVTADKTWMVVVMVIIMIPFFLRTYRFFS